MGRSILKEFTALVGLSVAVWFGFYSLDLGKSAEEGILSVDQEEKLGGLLLGQLLIGHPEINTPALDDAVAQISQRLFGAVGESDYRYRIIVVEHTEVNAFALPGGNIVVHSALLEKTESAEELAAVIAHEMGHVEKRHVTKKLVKTLSLEILTGALTGGDTVLLGEVLKTGVSTMFDRAQEEEADSFALDLLVDAQINPRVVASIFRKLQSAQVGEYDEQLAIISTHPQTAARVRSALQYRVPLGVSFVSIELDWPAVLTALRVHEMPAAQPNESEPTPA